LTTYISQGSAAADLREDGDFNCIILCRSFPNLTVKKSWKLIHRCRIYSASKLARNFWHPVQLNVLWWP